jgi:hypothetical protein
MVGMLSHREAKAVSDAVITNCLGREARDKAADIVKYTHADNLSTLSAECVCGTFLRVVPMGGLVTRPNRATALGSPSRCEVCPKDWIMVDEVRKFYEEFLPSGATVQSIPLKPPSFRTAPMKSHSLPREPKSRSIAALAAAAAAANVDLTPGAVIPRRLADPPSVLENGAASDIIRAGMATVGSSGGAEALILTEKGICAIQATVPPAAMKRYFGQG